MNADKILKRDAELRENAYNDPRNIEDAEDREDGLLYLANIAAAERTLIEAVSEVYDTGEWEMRYAGVNRVMDAYRALLSAMEAAQR